MIQRIGKKEIILLLAVSSAIFVGGLIAVIVDTVPEWKYYQSEFTAIVAEELGDVERSAVPRGIQQIWVDELDLVDRCTSCHLGIDWRGLEKRLSGCPVRTPSAPCGIRGMDFRAQGPSEHLFRLDIYCRLRQVCSR